MSSKAEEILTTIAGAILFVVAIFSIIVLASITHGFVLSILWGWFLVPLGAPALGIAHTIGIALLTRYLTYHHNNCEKEKEENPIVKVVAQVFIHPMMVLFVGWIVHLFLI